MISNEEIRRRLEILAVRAMSERHEAKSKRQRWLYLAVKKTINIIKWDNV